MMNKIAYYTLPTISFLIVLFAFAMAGIGIAYKTSEPQRLHCKRICGDDYIVECSDTKIHCRKKLVVKE